VHDRRRSLHPTPRKTVGGVGLLVGKSRETDLDLGRHPLKNERRAVKRPVISVHGTNAN
jgi:hypothetical protein